MQLQLSRVSCIDLYGILVDPRTLGFQARLATWLHRGGLNSRSEVDLWSNPVLLTIHRPPQLFSAFASRSGFPVSVEIHAEFNCVGENPLPPTTGFDSFRRSQEHRLSVETNICENTHQQKQTSVETHIDRNIHH